MPDQPTQAEAAPAASAETVDVSLDSIVADVLASAEAAGTAVVAKPEGDVPAAEPAPGTETPAAPSADPTAAPVAEPPATNPAPDAAAARKILAAAERKEADARGMVERATVDLTHGLRSAPKATLAKLGLTLDELIDAHLAEGDAPAGASAAAPQNDLERKVAAMEERDLQRQVDARKAEVRATVLADARFPTIRQKNGADIVVDFMVEYHATHGAPISWDRAATIVERDLRGLAGSPPAAARPVAPAAPARAATDTLRNDQIRTAPPADEEDPTVSMDPDRAMKWLVEHA
jgi:hypothetical protein